MKTVKINARGAGKWADPDSTVPQIEVQEGDIVEVSLKLADIMVPNCASYVDPAKEKPAEPAMPANEDVKEGEVKKKTPATKDKKAAESK